MEFKKLIKKTIEYELNKEDSDVCKYENIWHNIRDRVNKDNITLLGKMRRYSNRNMQKISAIFIFVLCIIIVLPFVIFKNINNDIENMSMNVVIDSKDNTNNFSSHNDIIITEPTTEPAKLIDSKLHKDNITSGIFVPTYIIGNDTVYVAISETVETDKISKVIGIYKHSIFGSIDLFEILNTPSEEKIAIKYTNNTFKVYEKTEFSESEVIPFAFSIIRDYIGDLEFPQLEGSIKSKITIRSLGYSKEIPIKLETEIEKTNKFEYTFTLIMSWDSKDYKDNNIEDKILKHIWKFKATPTDIELIEESGHKIPY